MHNCRAITFDYEESSRLTKVTTQKNKDFIEIVPHIDWVDYFLGIAKIVSARSQDAQTKHGCVITDRNNHIIGTGYNSFPRDMPDNILANLRDAKYKYMIHAEDNAITNTILSPWTVPKGAIAYVTGKPCLNCLYKLWGNNVTKIYAEQRQGSKYEEKEQDDFNLLISKTDLKYYVVESDLSWLENILQV